MRLKLTKFNHAQMTCVHYLDVKEHYDKTT